MKTTDKLIQDCISGDRKAQEQLFKLVFPYLYSLCIRYTNNEADAKAQLNECFYKVLINLDKKKKDVPFKSWLRVVCINNLINNYHKSKTKNNRLEIEQLETHDYHLTHESDVEQQMNAAEIINLLQFLPETSRKIFNLYAIDGYKHDEIAEMLSISAGTSRWHLNNARTQLKNMLNKKRKTA